MDPSQKTQKDQNSFWPTLQTIFSIFVLYRKCNVNFKKKVLFNRYYNIYQRFICFAWKQGKNLLNTLYQNGHSNQPFEVNNERE